MPITPFMGVRISWLMVARKALLAWLADSALSRLLSASSLQVGLQPVRLLLALLPQKQHVNQQDAGDTDQVNKVEEIAGGTIKQSRKPRAMRWSGASETLPPEPMPAVSSNMKSGCHCIP